MDIEQVGNAIFNSNDEESDEEQVDSAHDFSPRQQMIDAFDYQLLRYQAIGQVASIAGYLYGYLSTLYGLQVLDNKYSPDRDNLVDPDPDIPALRGAEILIIAQTILLYVSKNQYEHYYDNYSRNNLNAAKSATYEVYLGDFLEIIAYTFGYIGIKQIYDINHNTDPDNPVMD